MKQAYRWQKEAFNKCKDLNAYMLNVAMGGGKTFMAIQLAQYRKLPVLVICPKNLQDNWKAELIDAGEAEESIFLYDQPSFSADQSGYTSKFYNWLNHGKWLVMPTQNFSMGGITGKKDLTPADLPFFVLCYCDFHKKNIFCVLDEASWVKQTQPCPEYKKSNRCRLIKMLEKYTAVRVGLTGTLVTKSPVNVLDPYQFLSSAFFKGEDAYDIANNYCIMMNLRTARGRRVMISQKEWDKARKRLVNAFNMGGEERVDFVKRRLNQELGLTDSDCEHILKNRYYMPFINIDKLMKRMESVTVTVRRQDIFDIKNDKFVYAPIPRPVTLKGKGLQLGNELVKLGFTDDLVLGKAKALELMHRLKDICNGFIPIKEENAEAEMVDDEYVGAGKVRFEPLPENPKLDALKDLLEEIDPKEQVVVFVSRKNAFQSVADMLTQEGIPFAAYSGSQKAEEKAEAEEKARTGQARVFLANAASAAFGLNCLKKFNYLVWYCVDASVERYSQAQHRILRGQSLCPKFAYKIYVKGSVEERNFRALEAGVELLTASNRKETFVFR